MRSVRNQEDHEHAIVLGVFWDCSFRSTQLCSVVLKFNFNPKKATQAAAYLLKRNDGDMDMYLWIKLLYLADRAALEKWEEPITGDFPSSMPLGPVLSNIYDL